MTTFAHPSLLDHRYTDIAETSVFTYDDDDLVNYADFLRKHGRYMNKDGFVDSSRRIRSLHRQQDDLFVAQHRTSPSRPGGLLAALNKAAFPTSTGPSMTLLEKKSKSFAGHDLPSVISISNNLEHKEKEHDKQMRLIEEQIIKAKQSERESKRDDGDMKKEHRHLNHTLKELDMDATKKRFESEKSLSKNLEEKDRIERDFLKKREQQMKQHTDPAIDVLKTNKDKDRRNILACNELARQYRIKANELELAQQQINRLHHDFEQKAQQKEIEENRIKKELGEIAIELNLEAQKAKQETSQFENVMHRDRTQTIKHDLKEEKQFEQRLNETSIHVKNYDLERRRLSADVTLHRSTLDLKKREALRRIVDTKNRLETIYAEQRQLNQTAAVAEQDRRAAELMSKMADVESRRTQLMNQYLREKTQRTEEREMEGTFKAKARHAENQTRQHEDHLRHFQKIVSKNEEVEHDLRKSVKEVEFERRKKEEEVKQLQEELNRKKQEDAARIREEIARAEREERELEQVIIQEKSELDKLHVKREDNYLRLLKQREQIRENKARLENHAKEYERLLRVQVRSQSIQTNNTV